MVFSLQPICIKDFLLCTVLIGFCLHNCTTWIKKNITSFKFQWNLYSKHTVQEQTHKPNLSAPNTMPILINSTCLHLACITIPFLSTWELKRLLSFLKENKPFYLTVITSSQQCILAMDSESRIILSSWRTVIRHADLVTPDPSLWRSRLYCSTMKSSDSFEIYSDTGHWWDHIKAQST